MCHSAGDLYIASFSINLIGFWNCSDGVEFLFFILYPIRTPNWGVWVNDGWYGVNDGWHGVNDGWHGVNDGWHGVNDGWHGVNDDWHGVSDGWHGVNDGWHGVNDGWHGVNDGWHGVNDDWHGVNDGWHGVNDDWHGVSDGCFRFWNCCDRVVLFVFMLLFAYTVIPVKTKHSWDQFVCSE
jgi:hypothetical protein